MKQTIMIALCVLSFAFAAARKTTVNKPRNTLAFASGKAGAGACSSYVCSYGFHPKRNHTMLNGSASDANCCDPTCAKFYCPNGWKAHEGYLSNVGRSNEECCDKTCSQFTACKNDTGVSTMKENEPGITQEECCEPTCRVHSCIGNWAQDTSKKYVVSNKSEECCLPSCQSIKCESPNFIAHPNRGDKIAGPGIDYCCQKTCSHYKSQCPNNTGVPSEKFLTVPPEDGDALEACCDAKCSGQTCDFGFTLVADHLNKYVSKVTPGCCEMTCKAYECGSGWVKNPATGHHTMPADDICCETTCALYNCTSGYFTSKDPLKLNGTNRSNENCCERSCKAHTCPAGMSKRPLADHIPDPEYDLGIHSDNGCCEPHACKHLRKHRTPTSIQQGDSIEGLDCNHFDASEEKNCSEKYKLFNMSGILTAVPCILHAKVNHCIMDDANIATNCSDLGLSESSSSSSEEEEEEE